MQQQIDGREIPIRFHYRGVRKNKLLGVLDKLKMACFVIKIKDVNLKNRRPPPLLGALTASFCAPMT